MLRVGELVWATIEFQRDGQRVEKERPALVLLVRVDDAVIAWGTGTLREPCLCVEPSHRWGRAWQLSKTTYFHERNILAVEPEVVRRLAPTGRIADPKLLAAVLAVVEPYLATLDD